MTPEERLKKLEFDFESLKKEKKEKENRKQLQSDLKSFYEQLLDRRKVLSSQAQNITGFTGLIQAILVGLMVALVTSNDAQNILGNLAEFYYLKILIVSGFTSYIITILLALLAFFETKVRLVPQLSATKPNEKFQDRIARYNANPSLYDSQQSIKQYGVAIDDLRKTNKIKSLLIFFSIVFLVIGIISTLIGGYIILSLKISITGLEMLGVWIPLGIGLSIGLVYTIITFLRNR